MTRAQIGRIGLSKAIDYFTIEGYTISLPMNDTQWYDLVIEKDGVFQTVQCKATQADSGEIDFRSTGGTKGSVYSNILDAPIDILFCVNKDFVLYSIPMLDIKASGNKNSIKLRIEKTANNQGFQTHKYIVGDLNLLRYLSHHTISNKGTL